MPDEQQDSPDPGAFTVDRDPGDEASGQLLYHCPVCTNEEILYGQVSCQKCEVALVWSGDRIDQPRVHPAEAEESRPLPVPGVGGAPPRGESTSGASGVQEAEAPVSALETPGSLPGESKPSNEGQKPEVQPLAAGAVDISPPTLPDDPDPVAPHSGLRCSEIAVVAHSANVAYRQVVGLEPGPSWLQADSETQESCIAGVRAVLAGQINGPVASHKAWYDRKLAEGWTAGELKSIAAKTHPNMAALGVWGDLPETERRKDLLFLAIVVALVRAP